MAINRLIENRDFYPEIEIDFVAFEIAIIVHYLFLCFYPLPHEISPVRRKILWWRRACFLLVTSFQSVQFHFPTSTLLFILQSQYCNMLYVLFLLFFFNVAKGASTAVGNL